MICAQGFSTAKKFHRGFTLIGLLLVILIIGVLATIVLLPMNPLEQLARSRDEGRKNTISQISRAADEHYVMRGGTYSPPSSSWMDILHTSGDLKAIPQLSYSTSASACTTNSQNNYCYDTNYTDAIIYTVLESQLEASKCDQSTGEIAYFLWSSADSNLGVICATSEPSQFSGYIFK